MNLPLFIARRLYGSRTAQGVSRPAVRIATLGMAVGVAVMILSVCIVLGFKAEIKSKLMGFGAHIQVASMDRTRSYESHPIVASDSLMQCIQSIPGVARAQRYVTRMGVLKTDDQFRGVGLKGVGEEYDTRFLRSCLVEGEIPAFSDTTSAQRMVISRIMAQEMKLKLGDRVFCYFMDDPIRARRLEVVGIYDTHLTEFDKQLILTDRSFVQRLNGWLPEQASGIEVFVQDYDQVASVYDYFVQRINTRQDAQGATYYAVTIEQLYPSLFAWLGLLDLNVWVILFLMLAVAGFTMISGLLIIILERTQMIGTFKALGATNRQIRHIFLYFACMVIARGLFWGNIIGLAACWIQQRWGLVHLNPEDYYVEVVPIQFQPLLLVGLNIGTLLISMLVLVGPSYVVSHIHPARSIRFE